MSGTPYEKNMTELIRCHQGGNQEEDLSSVFCSELVAAALKKMGVLKNNKVFFFFFFFVFFFFLFFSFFLHLK